MAAKKVTQNITRLAATDISVLADAPMTWSLGPSSFMFATLIEEGDMRELRFRLVATTVGGSPAARLLLQLNAAVVPPAANIPGVDEMICSGVAQAEGSLNELVSASIGPNGRIIDFRRAGGANWPLGSANLHLSGHIRWEVQPK